jgi:Yip1 domain
MGIEAMSDVGPARMGNALLDRVKAIVLSPKAEWLRIDTESSTIADIYKSHVFPLAAIGPVASFIGGQLFGYGAFGISFKPSFIAGMGSMVVSYVFALIGIFICALVIDALAPQFGAIKNRVAAFKVSAYGATAAWVAGIFGILPAIGMLSILGLYSLYLIYTGLPVLMKAPQDKAIGYTAVVLVAMVVIGIVISLITTPVAMMFGGGSAMMADRGTVSGTVNVPGAGAVDMSKLNEAAEKMQAMAKCVENGQAAPVIAADVLQGLLPTSLNGLSRTAIESQSGGAAGIAGSNAEARYGSGDTEIKLSVTDMGAMGGIAALGGALNVQSSKQEGTSYEKVGKVEGRMTTEKFDSARKSGSYGTIVGDRVMVQAEGKAASIDVLKAAVVAVDLAKVEGLARQ